MGQIFPSYTALFTEVTGKAPSSGRTRKIEQANLKRHVEYRLQCEIDPTVTSKRSIQVTAIHEPPLKNEHDGRGRDGVYINHLRPLILQQRSFTGKRSELFNRIGLFSDFAEEAKRSPYIQYQLKASPTNPFDFDMWGIDNHMQRGEMEYRTILRNIQRTALNSALGSLQREGILEWSEGYVLSYDIFTPMENGEPRIKAYQEL